MSLVEVLVAIVLVGVSAVVMIDAAGNASKIERHLKLRQDLKSIRATLMEMVSCRQTFDQYLDQDTKLVVTCPDDIELKGDSGAVLGSKTQPMPGSQNVYLSTRCTSGDLENGQPATITVNGIFLQPGSSISEPNYVKHPLTGEDLDEDSSINPLVSSVASRALCPEKFSIRPKFLELEVDLTSLTGAELGGVTSADCAAMRDTPLDDWGGAGVYLTATTIIRPRLNDFCRDRCRNFSGNVYKIGLYFSCKENDDNVVNCLCLR
jgi:type II secretory pathway pseudopilin PulG